MQFMVVEYKNIYPMEIKKLRRACYEINNVFLIIRLNFLSDIISNKNKF